MIEPSTVYVDDSGTEAIARIVTAAFCVSTVEKWKAFEKKWKAIGVRAGFAHFHMTEFAACKRNALCRDCRKGKTTVVDHPWREWSRSKRKNVLTQLARTIEKYADCGFGIAITKEDYEDHVLNSPARYVANEPIGEEHFTYAVQVTGRNSERFLFGSI